MKKFNIVFIILLVAVFFVFAAGSGEGQTENQGSATISKSEQGVDQSVVNNETAAPEEEEPEGQLGDYSVIIDSCRLAEDYADKPVVIVKYIFTNVKSEEAACFSWTIENAVYQNGVGLNEAYILEDSANYSSDNQTKEIKKGASLEVEVAYELDDETTDIEVEVKELISFDNKVITKTFSIAE